MALLYYHDCTYHYPSSPSFLCHFHHHRLRLFTRRILAPPIVPEVEPVPLPQPDDLFIATWWISMPLTTGMIRVSSRRRDLIRHWLDVVAPITIAVTIHLNWAYHQLLHRNQPLILRPVLYSNMISIVFHHQTIPAQAIWIKKLERRASTHSWQTSMIKTTDAIDSSANAPQNSTVVKLDW